jgi:hypothetical protein
MDGHEQVGYNASMHPHDAYTVTAYPATEREIEAEFPGWRVWRTADAGTWWASGADRCGTANPARSPPTPPTTCGPN